MVIENKILIAVLISVVLSQCLKLIIYFIEHKVRFKFSDLLTTGGFPSTHTAAVTSLAFSIFLEQKFSALFAIALVLFVIVITDSLGVRRTAGEEADIINKVLKTSKTKKFHISHGHTPAEVLAGMAIGLVVPILIYFL